MTSLRPVTVLLLATTLGAASGCRTAGTGDLARRDALPSRAEESAVDLLVEHNRNAERVKSLEASPSVSSANPGQIGSLHGKLALERPRNFQLGLFMPISGQAAANIGSNDQKFWFWAKSSPEKAVYYCNYDETGACPVSAAGLQPDWIIEALGLRVFTDEEAAKIKVTPGKVAGTVTLTETQETTQGERLIKETVLDEATGRIREHWVFAADPKKPLAHAVVSEYKEYPVPGETGSAAAKVYLPLQLRLEWILQETMASDVILSGVKINPTFPPKRRQAMFLEPNYPGYARVDLERAGLASAGDAAPPTSVRETLPAPPPRVRLSAPTPLGSDGARRSGGDPADLAADLIPPAYARGVEEVVGPPIPTIAEPVPRFVESRSGWRGSMAAGLER